MATDLNAILALIPDGPEYDILRWTISKISKIWTYVTFDPARVEKWVTGIKNGDYTATKKRADILEHMVGEQAIMDAYGVDAATAQKIISGETTMESMGEVEPLTSAPGPKLLNIPGGGEVWKIGGKTYVVYTVPGSQPPVYMRWVIPANELEALFGPDVTPVYVRTIDDAAAAQLGMLDFGSSVELANFDDDPFLTWAQTMEVEAQSQPWILDDDYQALVAMAILEGRGLTEAEIQSTDWWRDHSKEEREWFKLFNGDPETAQSRLEDNRLRVLQSLLDAGVENPSEGLINYMADQVTMGAWTTTYFNTQLTAVADPFSPHTLDPELEQYVVADTGTTREGELTVENLVTKWLGPVHGQWDTALINEWAGKIRNDPDAVVALTDFLRSQRLVLFPEYENENLTYQDIAAPWKGFVNSMWGQTADETDPLFATLLKNNDAHDNAQLLRKEGLTRGIGKIEQDAQEQMLTSTGGAVRRPV